MIKLKNFIKEEIVARMVKHKKFKIRKDITKFEDAKKIIDKFLQKVK